MNVQVLDAGVRTISGKRQRATLKVEYNDSGGVIKAERLDSVPDGVEPIRIPLHEYRRIVRQLITRRINPPPNSVISDKIPIPRKHRKLNDDAIAGIMRELAQHVPQCEIAERYGVSPSLVSRLNAGTRRVALIRHLKEQRDVAATTDIPDEARAVESSSARD